MKKLLFLAAALILGGCSQVSTNPYKVLYTGVQLDDAVVLGATSAVEEKVLPAKDAAVVYSAEEYVLFGLPAAEALAGATGVPTAPGAITKAQLDAEIGVLATDLDALHAAITAASGDVVGVARVNLALKAKLKRAALKKAN